MTSFTSSDMSENLTNADFTVLKHYVDNQDRYHYWSYLQNRGDPYAGLALGVVTNETLAGYTANAFLTAKGQAAGLVMDAEELNKIGVKLMEADFDVRKEIFDKNKGNSLHLGIFDIQTYHDTVFKQETDKRLDITAWTAELPLRQAMAKGKQTGDYSEAEAIWSDLMGDLPALAAWHIVGTPIADEMGWVEETGFAAAGFERGVTAKDSNRNIGYVEGWSYEPLSGCWFQLNFRDKKINADEQTTQHLNRVRALRQKMFGDAVIDQPEVILSETDINMTINGWTYEDFSGKWLKRTMGPELDGFPTETVQYADEATSETLNRLRASRLADKPTPNAQTPPSETPRQVPELPKEGAGAVHDQHSALSPAEEQNLPIEPSEDVEVGSSEPTRKIEPTMAVVSSQNKATVLASAPRPIGFSSLEPTSTAASPADNAIDPSVPRSHESATKTLPVSFPLNEQTGLAALAPQEPILAHMPVSRPQSLIETAPPPHSLAPLPSDDAVRTAPPLPTAPQEPPAAPPPVGPTIKHSNDDMRAVAQEVMLGLLQEHQQRMDKQNQEVMLRVLHEHEQAKIHQPRDFSREELRIIIRAVIDHLNDLADRPATGRAGFDGRMSKQFVSTYNPRGLRW